MKLGTDNAIKYASRMNAPAYIAPSSASADIYQKEIQAIEDTINKVAYDLTTNQRDNNLKWYKDVRLLSTKVWTVKTDANHH